MNTRRTTSKVRVKKKQVKKAGQRSHSLGDFVASHTTFVSIKKSPKQTLCSLPAPHMPDIASNFILKTSCTISGTSVAEIVSEMMTAPLKYSLALINRPLAW